MNNHPITPSPELIQQWIIEGRHQDYCSPTDYAIAKSAQWGADQELEACCADVSFLKGENIGIRLRRARRPKPLGLKEQALEALREAESSGCLHVNGRSDIIRRALESLDDN